MADLNDIINKINKELGKDEHIGSLGLAENFLSFDSYVPFGVPTGLPQLDLNLQRLGYPAGKVIEVYGFERSGKSALAMAAVAACQHQGGNALWIETEHTFDWDRAKRAGIDTTRLLLVEADSIEAVIRVMELTLKQIGEVTKNSPFIVVVDSITAASTEFELDEKHMKAEGRLGGEAKAIRRGLKRINPIISKTGATVLFINHAIASMAGFGNSKQSAGGHALKFFASLRICLAHFKQLKTDDKTQLDGQEIQFTFEKYKGAVEAENKIIETLKNGIFSPETSLMDAMVKTELLRQVGHSYEMTWDDKPLKFKKDDWEIIIEQCGGYDEVYTTVKDSWIESGKVKPWGI